MPTVAIALPLVGLATAYSVGAGGPTMGHVAAQRYSPPTHGVLRMAAPQYTSQAALVSASRPVCPNGRSWLLQLSGQESPTEYEPGHVLAIEVDHQGTTLKGPYTVTRSDAASRTIDCIYRVIDGPRESSNGDHVASGVRKTQVFKSLETGVPAAFGGSFHVPILRGIAPGARHAFLVSTGAGVGPMIGFVEQCVAMWEGTSIPGAPGIPFKDSQLERVTLFAGYRELGDVICAEELEALVAASNGRFEWHACISGADELNDCEVGFSALAGRTTNTAPPLIASALPDGFEEAHFHMIGNGAMVKDWQLALGEAGVPEEQVTVEMYFGHKEEPDQAASECIKQGILHQDLKIAALAGPLAA